KLVLRNEGEYVTTTDKLERLESQVRLQVPITTFFDAVAGLRADTPEGPDRLYGVAGIHGLAPQWFEVDLDFFLSDRPWLRFEADYEALITNYLILTPSLEVDLPLVDDDPVEAAAWGPKVEVGLRLSYDLVDRSVAPYIGFHYERLFGGTKDIRTDEGGDGDAFFAVAGMRLMF
ncbi:MAG: copper resistance protein B, partial [Rhodospirillales bacterium]